ncbi:MAG: LLM class F420-dependent oxidoreductase [Solirubrobacterales bacterium]|nr:LLM class F420-dependent oxidoreductase [Solirubrobacterales bacterium]
MKLGLNTGYWGQGPPAGVTEAIAEADRLEFDSIWTAEAYGSDALTPLAWWGSSTKNVRLGTAIMQMSARQPTAAAMAAVTMDHLSGGRFILGLGVSGPQVVEGWYGQPFAKPLSRTREYVKIVRDVIARDGLITNDGPHYPLPFPGGTGLAKSLKPTLHPLRKDIPIFLGAEGPKNVALAAEICDGWLPMFYSPHHEAFYREALAEGFARETARRTADSFEITATVPVIIHDDVEAAADFLRPMYALYFGGMGARGANFHNDVPVRMGYADAAKEIQDLYLDGKKAEAAAAVPTALIEQMSLIGSEDKIRYELDAWRESMITTMLIGGDAPLINRVAQLILG